MCAEDYLIDDDISARQFNGTLTFAAETASSQTAVEGIYAYLCYMGLVWKPSWRILITHFMHQLLVLDSKQWLKALI